MILIYIRQYIFRQGAVDKIEPPKKISLKKRSHQKREVIVSRAQPTALLKHVKSLDDAHDKRGHCSIALFLSVDRDAQAKPWGHVYYFLSTSL